MEQLIRAEKLNLRPLITRILPLEAYDEGFELVKSAQASKILLKP